MFQRSTSRLGFLSLMLAGAVSLATVSVVAQSGSDQQSAPPQSAPMGKEGGGHRHFDPEKRTEMLTKQLNLTSDQQPKVLDILKSEQSKMQSLWSDSSTAQSDRQSKMMDIHKTTNDQIRALLTSDQQKKFDAMQERQHERWQGHQDGQGPGASGDSQQK
jgi:Spy/CpxP family protein refolding chaperone